MIGAESEFKRTFPECALHAVDPTRETNAQLVASVNGTFIQAAVAGEASAEPQLSITWEKGEKNEKKTIFKIENLITNY